MERFQQNRRIILIAVVALVLVCLLGVLAYNVFTGNGGQDVAVEPPTATLVSTDEVEVETSAPEEDQTPTPTRVIADDALEETAGEEETEESNADSIEELAEEPTTEPTAELTVEPTTEPTATPTAASVAAAGSSSSSSSTTATGSTFTGSNTPVEVETEIVQNEEILKNSSFEEGFDEDGVGINWQGFGTGDAVVNFTAETAIPFVESGDNAQRISIDKGMVPDQYGGIYQTVDVTPGKVYTLTLNGQIRSGYGDVDASSYGYRVQYAIDYDGSENWRTIPAEDWIELTWEEQAFDADEFTFTEYTTQVTPTSDTMTIFVRGWNKWADQNLGEYTLDSLSLVGPVTRTVMIASTETGADSMAAGTSGGESGMAQTGTTSQTEEEMVDGALPVTGTQDGVLVQDGRFWGAIMVMILLILGAIYQAKWSWSRSNR